jgi:outer membrane protein TolC
VASERNSRPWLVVLAMTTALGACEVGPDYERPTAATPVAYKEIDGWKPSTPSDLANRGPWWSIYNDPLLD